MTDTVTKIYQDPEKLTKIVFLYHDSSPAHNLVSIAVVRDFIFKLVDHQNILLIWPYLTPYLFSNMKKNTVGWKLVPQ